MLYHLADPVGHLQAMRPLVKHALLLDTHIATPGGARATYSAGGREYRYQRQGEANRSSPFAGLGDHARWLEERDLIDAVTAAGFANPEILDRRDERNVPRILLTAHTGDG